MPKGVVLWPDDGLAAAIGEIGTAVAATGCRLLPAHKSPHLSLVVADDLDEDAVAAACPVVPLDPIPCSIASVGVFPGGIAFLAVRTTGELLAEQERVHRLTVDHLERPWRHYAPGAWTPHVTLATGLDDDEAGRVVAAVLPLLPLDGWLTSGGIEDGATGERRVLG